MKTKIKAKDRILFAAFKLYMTGDRDKVTLVEIENETGLTRGSILYHFKDLHDLFDQTVERFFFSTQRLDNKMKLVGIDTLRKFLDQFIESINLTMMSLGNISGAQSAAYLRFIFRAHSNYRSFKEKADVFKNIEMHTWRSIIVKAIEQNEIKPDIDIDVTISKFRYVYLGLTYEQSLEQDRLDIELLKKLFDHLYNEIKIVN